MEDRGLHKDGRRVSILDVLDDAFDGRPPETEAEADELLEKLDASWSEYAPCATSDGEIRLMPIMRGLSPEWMIPATAACTDHDETTDRGASRLRRFACAAFLTGHVVVDVDPFSRLYVIRNYRAARRYFDDDGYDGVPAHESRVPLREMRRCWSHVQCARPLLEAGVLRLTPQPLESANEEGRLEAVVQPVKEHGLHPLDAFFVEDTARLAAASHSVLLPRRVNQWDFLAAAARAGELSPDQPVEAKMAAALAAVKLPVLKPVAAKTLVHVREHEAFADWRNSLATASRLIRALPTDDAFEREAAEVYREILEPVVEQTRRAISSSRALQEAFRENAVRAVLGAAAATGLGADPETAAGAAAATFLASMAYAATKKPRLEGAAAIVSILLNDDAHSRAAVQIGRERRGRSGEAAFRRGRSEDRSSTSPDADVAVVRQPGQTAIVVTGEITPYGSQRANQAFEAFKAAVNVALERQLPTVLDFTRCPHADSALGSPVWKLCSAQSGPGGVEVELLLAPTGDAKVAFQWMELDRMLDTSWVDADGKPAIPHKYR